MDRASIPPGRAQARELEDRLVICTIWSRGKRYHFIFRGRRHSRSHMLTPAERKQFHFRIPPCVFQSTSPDKLSHISRTFTWAHRCLPFFFFWHKKKPTKLCLNHFSGDLHPMAFFCVRHKASPLHPNDVLSLCCHFNKLSVTHRLLH